MGEGQTQPDPKGTPELWLSPNPAGSALTCPVQGSLPGVRCRFYPSWNLFLAGTDPILQPQICRPCHKPSAVFYTLSTRGDSLTPSINWGQCHSAVPCGNTLIPDISPPCPARTLPAASFGLAAFWDKRTNPAPGFRVRKEPQGELGEATALQFHKAGNFQGSCGWDGLEKGPELGQTLSDPAGARRDFLIPPQWDRGTAPGTFLCHPSSPLSPFPKPSRAFLPHKNPKRANLQPQPAPAVLALFAFGVGSEFFWVPLDKAELDTGQGHPGRRERWKPAQLRAARRGGEGNHGRREL